MHLGRLLALRTDTGAEGCWLYRITDAAARYHKPLHCAQSGPHSLLTHGGDCKERCSGRTQERDNFFSLTHLEGFLDTAWCRFRPRFTFSCHTDGCSASCAVVFTADRQVNICSGCAAEMWWARWIHKLCQNQVGVVKLNNSNNVNKRSLVYSR